MEYKQPPVLVTNLSGGVELGAGWSAALGINGDVLGNVGAYWYGRISYRF